MTIMTTNQARIVDPVLTNIATGYLNAAYVGSKLFPRVSVAARGGRIPQFYANNFRRYNTQRAPGAKVQQLQVEYSRTSFSLVDHNLDGLVPRELLEDARAIPNIDLLTEALLEVTDAVQLQLEYDQASLARNASNFGANLITYNGGTSWKNAGAAPLADIAVGKGSIQSSTGVMPNTLILSQKSFVALQNHSSVIDRLKYTSSNSVTTDLIARLTDVENVYIGAALWVDDSSNSNAIWGDDAVLAYVPPVGGYKVPSFGYTYSLNGYPNAEQPFWDNSIRSWLVPYNDCRMPVLTGVASGYLFAHAGL